MPDRPTPLVRALRRTWARLRRWWARQTRDPGPSPSLWDPDRELGRRIREHDHIG
jgi:hypothetical protein